MSEQADTPPSLVGGRYEIIRPLAAGGMARVFVARHHLTRQEVALKIIEAVFARDQAGVARFLREVSVASRIQHEGVVRVFDAGFDPSLGSPYLAMELLEGQSLAQLLAERAVDQLGALRYVLDFLAPLAAAHDAGVVHRDLKPENVFVTRAGQVKLLDFGVARDLRGSRMATTEGTALGTVYYMAPEQALDARTVGAEADVYAVGVTLYQILCGIFPFDGTTPHAVLIRAHREVAVPASTRAPWLHPNLAELVDRCLAKSPQDRPADAASLRGILDALLADPAVCATVEGRSVNPATFLSTPPPAAASAVFEDPFSASASAPLTSPIPLTSELKAAAPPATTQAEARPPVAAPTAARAGRSGMVAAVALILVPASIVAALWLRASRASERRPPAASTAVAATPRADRPAPVPPRAAPPNTVSPQPPSPPPPVAEPPSIEASADSRAARVAPRRPRPSPTRVAATRPTAPEPIAQTSPPESPPSAPAPTPPPSAPVVPAPVAAAPPAPRPAPIAAPPAPRPTPPAVAPRPPPRPEPSAPEPPPFTSF